MEIGSDNHKVLSHLKTGQSLTCYEAKERGFTQDLRSRVSEINSRAQRMNQPYTIHSKMIHVRRTDGKYARVAKYKLKRLPNA